MLAMGRRWSLALAVLGCAYTLVGCRPSSGLRDSRDYAAAVRAGALADWRKHGPVMLSPRGNTVVIDAYLEVIEEGDERRLAAAVALSGGGGLVGDSTLLERFGADDLLPSRAAPVLLAALDENAGKERRLHRALIGCLGLLDGPGPDTIAPVLAALDSDDRLLATAAARSAGMLGVAVAEAAAPIERMLHDAVASSRGEPHEDPRVLELAASLARVCEESPPAALDVLLAAAASDHYLRVHAVEHFRLLGPRAEPAAEELMRILSTGRAQPSGLAVAIAVVSPDRRPALLSLLTDMAGSPDDATARAADLQLHGLAAAEVDMRTVASELADILDARPVSYRASYELMLTLKLINTARTREAHNDYVSRRQQAMLRGDLPGMPETQRL